MNTFIRRFLSVLMVLLFLSPCITFATNVEENLVLGIQSTKTLTVRPLDPRERDMLSVYEMIYESLIYIDDNYLPQGYLAKSWSVSSNGKTWTFTLRDDVRFSDGTQLTAYDVVASCQAILNRANDEATVDQGFYANLKYYIGNITATDEQTVIIKAKRPSYALLYELTFPIVKESEVDTDFPVGSGPYQIAAFVAGDYMSLEVNPHWWQLKPGCKSIMIDFASTQTELMEDYEYARVDTIFTRSIAASQYKSGTSSISMSYRTCQLECLLMNNNASELTANGREAIRCAIDVDKIISTVYNGMATRTYTPMYPGTWTYNEALASYYQKDLDRARAMLEADGWEDADENGVLDRIGNKGTRVNLHLRFYVYEEPENDVRLEAANMISEALAEIGIECTPVTMTLAEMREKLAAGSFDLALVSYAMDDAPDPGFLLMRKNTGNYMRYASNTMNTLHEDLRKTISFTDYQAKLMQIQLQFAQDNPFLCLYYRMGTVLSRYMYTTRRDVREYHLLKGLESF